MRTLATITKDRSTPDRVIDAYMLRQARVLRPATAVVPKGWAASTEEVMAMFADYRLAMTPPLLAQVAQMTDAQRAGFMKVAGDTLIAAFATSFPNSPMYRAFPNHHDQIIHKDMIDFLLAFGMQDTVSTGADTHGAHPVTGEQTAELGPNADADADAAHSVPLVWKRTTFTPIALGSDADVTHAAQALLRSLSPFTPDDAEFISACVEEGFVTAEDLSSVKFREKLPALVGLVAPEVYDAAAISVTDALRLAAHFSKGDVSLTLPVKFKLPTSAAKRVLRMAESVIESGRGSPEEDVLRHAEAWKRLLRHVGTARASKIAPLLSMTIADVREKRVRSWNSQVAHAHPEDAARMMAQRPGAFVRGVVALSRRFNAEGGDRRVLLDSAQTAFAAAPAPALLQLHTVLARTVKRDDRFHVMKSGVVLHSERAPEDHDDLLDGLERALHARLAGTLPWSAAENGENRFVPIGGRTASQSGDGSVRGDSVVMPAADDKEKDVVRLFVHWKDPSDVDLTAIFMDGEGRGLGECAYYNLTQGGRGNSTYAIHSGDIQDGRRGAAEYVDVDVKKAREAGVKTVMLSVNVYSGKPFAEFPSHVGVMRRDGQTGKHFEISTVETAMRVTSNSTMCTCAMFDLETRRLTHVDMPARWAQRSNARTGADTLEKHATLLANYGDYRLSMADVLRFAGTEGGPVLTDRELVTKRPEIIAALADVPAGPAEDLDADSPGL